MFKIIVAHDLNRIIGNGLDIPWKIKEDLQHFKQVTLGHTIVYGSKTFQSIGHALKGRNNIVLSSNPDYNAPGCEVYTSIKDIIKKYKKSEEIVYICGGASIYEQFLPYCEELIISEIEAEYEGDIFFPFYLDKFELYKEDPRKEFTIRYYKKK